MIREKHHNVGKKVLKCQNNSTVPEKYSLRGRRKRGGGGGRRKAPSLFPYPLPLSTPATQATRNTFCHFSL